MKHRFRAFRIHQKEGKVHSGFEDIGLGDLADGEVVVRVTHSTINYKDALAATGAGKILRRYPLVGGIDLAGVVESSHDERYQPGEAVLVTGCALSETHDGGYAEYARVKGDWVIPIPQGPDGRDRHGARHGGLHGRTRHPPHGAERPGSGRRTDRRHRRLRRGR